MTGVRNAAACHCPFCFFLTEEENEKQCNNVNLYSKSLE